MFARWGRLLCSPFLFACGVEYCVAPFSMLLCGVAIALPLFLLLRGVDYCVAPFCAGATIALPMFPYCGGVDYCVAPVEGANPQGLPRPFQDPS